MAFLLAVCFCHYDHSEWYILRSQSSSSNNASYHFYLDDSTLTLNHSLATSGSQYSHHKAPKSTSQSYLAQVGVLPIVGKAFFRQRN